MKRIFEIHRKSNIKFNSFELSESVKINILQRKNINILSETYLPNILNYLREENLKEELNNEYQIVLVKEGKFVSNIYKPKHTLFIKIQNDIYKEIFPEIMEDSHPNNIIYNNLIKCCKSDNYKLFSNPIISYSNYWYIEEYFDINLNQKLYKLFSIIDCDLRNFIGKSDKLDILINNYIRENHKQFKLGPNAFVYLNDWTNELKFIKLPLRFNTNSLLKILNNPKENSENSKCLECNQELEKYNIIPYIDLQNKTIYIVSTHNKVGMTNIENVLKESMLVVCNPIKYDIIKNGWTLNLLNNIIESVEIELSSMYKKDNFKIELMF